MSDFAVTFRSTACLLYHFVVGLSRGFPKLFLSFFNLDLSFAFALRSRRQLCYYITSFPLCQYLFSLFFGIFHLFPFAKATLLCCRKDFALSDFILNSYAEVRTNEQARSDASNAAPLWVPARGGVRFKPYSTGVAPIYRPVARHRIKCKGRA